MRRLTAEQQQLVRKRGLLGLLESDTPSFARFGAGPPDRLKIRLVAERSNDPVAVALADFHPIGKVRLHVRARRRIHCKARQVQGAGESVKKDPLENSIGDDSIYY